MILGDVLERSQKWRSALHLVAWGDRLVVDTNQQCVISLQNQQYL
ncbi:MULTISPECIES: hypothetical protein [unclassified Microcoleus]